MKTRLCLFICLLLAWIQPIQAQDMVHTAVGDVWDSTTHSFRITYVSSASGWDVAEETSLTNTVHPLVTFTHTTDGTPANGIGLSLDWYQETAAANTELGARIATLATDTTATSEDFQMDFMLMTAGAAPATKLSIGSTGVLTLVNAGTIDNATNGTITITEPNISLVGVVATSNESALTNTVLSAVNLTHTTSGVPANGIGLEITATQETSAANNEIIGSLGFVVDDATGASEDASFSVELMTAGAAKAEVFAVESTGVVTLVNAETIDNSVNGTITYTATTHAFSGNVTASGSVDVVGAAGVILSNDETITNTTNGQIDLNGDVYLAGAVKYEACTIADGDATPDVAGCAVLTTSSNTGATEITDLDNPVVGSIVILIGGSANNSSTISDAGNFALSAGWTASVDETLTLYIQADNDYVELTRSTN